MPFRISSRRLLTAIACATTLAAGGVAAGCGSDHVNTDTSVADVSASSPTPAPIPTLEASGTMSEFMTQVFEDVSSFWTRELTQEGLPAPRPAYHWIAPGDVLHEACPGPGGRTNSTDGTAEYCQDDATIYFSQQAAVDIWQGKFVGNEDQINGRTGDFSVAMVIAHEYAHAVQDTLRIYDANPDLPQKAFELQADCLAGVWAHSVYQRGMLPADSIEQAVTSVAKVGDYQFDDPGHHGTPAERSAAFILGYNAGHGSQCTLGLGDGAALAL
jgi:predicted metalloprotease